ncbi:MAG TPA: tetratricopeptide repeat protein [Candidatus Hydrogenedentes bacterium]|nr:tetratricopeptide repeat protein [Candidatus Hydrogenedentota bacterium]HIJ74395.1 tetratricopeptide repeat protein [Candidatus Hydrogenedentota bacterium]
MQDLASRVVTRNGIQARRSGVPYWGAGPLLAAAAAVVIAAACADSNTYAPQARAKMQECRHKRDAASTALARNDFDAFQKHSADMQKLLEEAARLFELADAKHAGAPDLLKDYAEFLTWQGDPDLAADALRRAAKVSPDDAEIWLAMGRALSALGHHYANEAEQALHKVLSLDIASGQAAQAHIALGRLYRLEGLPDLARENYAKALEIAPNDGTARAAMALDHVRYGEMVQAVDDLAGLTELPPQFAQFLHEALAEFETAKRWIPDTAQDHLAYAELLTRVGRIDDGISPVERSLKLDPNQYVAWNLLGSLSRQLGNIKRAREAFTKSIELNPDQPRTQAALEELDVEPTGTKPAAPDAR